MADCYNSLGSWENGTLAPSEAMPKAKAAAERAVALDNMLAEAHTSLAYGIMHYDWDWPGTEARIQQAFDINPNYPTAHHWQSHYLTAMGRTEDSLAESKRFLELDPLDLLANAHLAWHYHFARQYDEAIEQCSKSNDLFPNSFWPSFFVALAYEQKGMLDEAGAERVVTLQLLVVEREVVARIEVGARQFGEVFGGVRGGVRLTVAAEAVVDLLV